MKFDDFLFVAAIIVSIGVGLCIGLGINDAPGAYEVAKDWQTLFAGILAVAAAMFTVGQMQRSDALQERRHSHLVRITLRADYLQARRAASLVDVMEMIWDDLPQVLPPINSDIDVVRKANAELESHVRDWVEWLREEAVGHRFVEDCEPLFDPDTAIIYDAVKDNLEDLDAIEAELRTTSLLGPVDAALAARTRAEAVLGEVSETLGNFIECLRVLPDEFR
ncbi:hypothetical protein [Mesorhizobium sp. ES1-1]|uniref:hypothetical protein n=1 Tax=Mesorhizobium sp. ES1-1 TaxID=2876629 RepID=UPI001CCA4387|nr:hypothetical protein [Mesorhizobium sp. ES1-1]MBZ9678920.1 hypothetical protein [Mesorhizobium sp. ES1-1]